MHRRDPTTLESAYFLTELTQLYDLIVATDYYGSTSLKRLVMKRAVDLLPDCWNSPEIFTFSKKVITSSLGGVGDIDSELYQGLADRIDIFGTDERLIKLVNDYPQLALRILCRVMSRSGYPTDRPFQLRYCPNWTCRKNVPYAQANKYTTTSCLVCFSPITNDGKLRVKPIW